MIGNDPYPIAGLKLREAVGHLHGRVFLQQSVDQQIGMIENFTEARGGQESARSVIGQCLAAGIQDDPIGRRFADDGGEHRQRAIAHRCRPKRDLRAIEVNVVAGAVFGETFLPLRVHVGLDDDEPGSRPVPDVDHESAIHDVVVEAGGSLQHSSEVDLGHTALFHAHFGMPGKRQIPGPPLGKRRHRERRS